jgi:hypothetical protein
MPKAPFIGFKGQFEDPRWQSANSEVWAYLEVEPIHAVDPVTGAATLLPAPQRNTWETPIQWLLALATFFSDSIKACTSIWDPSLGTAKSDQSGKAIDSLRGESSTGTFYIADNLHHAIQVLYEQIVIINTQILSGPRVVTIVKPDSSHEQVKINQLFTEAVTPATEQSQKKNWLQNGRYAVIVKVGPNEETRDMQTADLLIGFLKIDPSIMQNPAVAAKALRAMGQGSPQIEAIADLIDPQTNNPAQTQAQLQQATKQLQLAGQVIQELKYKLDAKIPDIEARKFADLLDNMTKIRVAEISASMDADRQKADLDAAREETLLGFAHDAATQAVDHEHEQGMAQVQAQNQSQQSAQEASQSMQQQEAAAAQNQESE